MKDFEPQLTRFHTSISEEPCMPDSSEFTAVADLFKLLGDSSRLKIFWILCHWEECVTSISERAGMTSPAVSHHLKYLKASQLIVSRREGKEVYYRTADTPQAQMVHHIIKSVLRLTCPGQHCPYQECVFSEVPCPH